MLRTARAIAFGLLALTSLNLAWAAAPAGGPRLQEQKLTCPMGREYYLATPAVLDPATPYWLVVGVHGYQCDGKDGLALASWARGGPVILLGPTFPSEGYQMLLVDSDKQLVGLFESLKQKYHLHAKMFICGFSGGAQFAHRFALKYPDLVIGCAAHSGGSWDRAPSPAAQGVAFAISCGLRDTQAMGGQPLSRLDSTRQFETVLAGLGGVYKARYWPNTAHEYNPGCDPLNAECFALATTGGFEDERPALQRQVMAAATLVRGGQYAKAIATAKALPDFKPGAPGAAAPGGATPAKVTPAAAVAGPAARTPAAGASGGGGGGGAAHPENKYGWHGEPEGLAAVRRSALAEASNELLSQIDKAGRDKLARLIKQHSPNLSTQLEALRQEFKDLDSLGKLIDAAQAPAPAKKP